MSKILKEQLQQWKKVHMKEKKQPMRKEPAQQKKKSEQFSESDLRYLMGSNMKTLRRGKGGALR